MNTEALQRAVAGIDVEATFERAVRTIGTTRRPTSPTNVAALCSIVATQDERIVELERIVKRVIKQTEQGGVRVGTLRAARKLVTS